MVRNDGERHGRHAAAPQLSRRRSLLVLAVLVVAAGAVTAFVLGRSGSTGGIEGEQPTTARAGSASRSGKAVSCAQHVRVVTAASYAPVLRHVAAGLTGGDDCVGVQLTVADGRAAAGVVAKSKADVWIADDASWTELPSSARLAAGHSILATSPFYFVTTRSAPPLPANVRSWLELARQLGKPAPGSRRLRLLIPPTPATEWSPPQGWPRPCSMPTGRWCPRWT